MELSKWLQRPVLQGSTLTYGRAISIYLGIFLVQNMIQLRRNGFLSLSRNLLLIAAAVLTSYSCALIDRKVRKKEMT